MRRIRAASSTRRKRTVVAAFAAPSLVATSVLSCRLGARSIRQKDPRLIGRHDASGRHPQGCGEVQVVRCGADVGQQSWVERGRIIA